MSSRPQIRLLPDQVINRIAAGEVVERPASVVKELLENSLDSGATEIEIRVVAGGRKLLQIADNGCGMSRDEALLAVERHATSKIRDERDLETVTTLGFRGEALASIASVSRFTLTTRPADMLEGTELGIHGGILQDAAPRGCPPGTCIAVRDLFFNVPARRKFLKSDATEVSHIRHLLVTYALAYTRVGWSLWVDDREVLRAPRDVALTERVAALFPPDWIAHLKPVDWEAGPIRVRGLVGDPRLARSDRQEHYLFINGRPVSAGVLYFALQQAYAGSLPSGQFPVVFLFIDLPPAQVDVNVHPAKREVRFRHSGTVRDAVITAVSLALRPGEALPLTAHPGVQPPPGSGFPARPVAPPAAPPPGLAYQGLSLLSQAEWERWSAPAAPLPGGAAPEAAVPAPGLAGVPTPLAVESLPPAWHPGSGEGKRASPWKRYRVIGMVGGLFALVETEDGLVVVDPQAAWERVLFERWMREVGGGAVLAQGLLKPETVNLPARDATLVRENLDALRELGFGIDEFGGDAFLVDSVPALLRNLAPAAVIGELAHALDQGGKRAVPGRSVLESLARTACQISGRQRGRWTVPELESLMDQLGQTTMPYTCPHGRPTMIFHGFNDLKSKFGRT